MFETNHHVILIYIAAYMILYMLHSLKISKYIKGFFKSQKNLAYNITWWIITAVIFIMW